jgi:hypothetical protein
MSSIPSLVSNDNSDEWADPPGVDDGEEPSTLVGPVTFPDLVFGVHALIALVLTPFVWSAFQEGNLPLVGSLGLLILLLLAAGVTMRRIAIKR